jgi:hypothetical protein
MRRLILLVVVVTVMEVGLSGTALGDPPSDSNGNPSCFGAFARSDAGTPGDTGGPGFVVGDTARTLGTSGAGGETASGVVQELQQARNEACPTNFPP